MPNWCNNVVTFRHENPEMIAKAIEGFGKGELLNTFIPVAQELLDTVAGDVADDKREVHEAQKASNIEKYGYKDWYDFCVAEWGTKWDIGDAGGIADYSQNELLVNFDSAWSPPIGAYDKLMELGFEVEAYYYEPGMGFCGIWQDGSDCCYDIPENADDVAKVIPDALDDLFCISENMAEWESDNA